MNRPAQHSALSTQHSALPAWYPPWARELAELYFSGTTCLFLLHGNVHDLIRCEAESQARYCNLAEFLAGQVFGAWELVLHYDLARGLRPLAGGDVQRLQAMLRQLASRVAGEPASWPRDPESVLPLLERLIERTLLEEDASRRPRLAVILEHAQYLVPSGDLGTLARGQSANLVRFLGWAQNPYIKRVNIALCLVAEKLTEFNDRLVQNPHVAEIEIPLPDREERERFARWIAQSKARNGTETAERGGTASESMPPTFGAEEVAELSSGLSLVNLNVLLSQGNRADGRVDTGRFRELKKSLIERQCRGLLEFIEPGHTLDLVVGHEAAKQRLREDAALIARGQFDAAPMGYLLCGPVGTGKSFLAECYAGSIGLPCVKLRNFRSKYVGETEGNLEQVLTVLRSLGPVVVMIDEADAAMGSRQTEGDSGVSSRVFSMIASQMGDTRYRGRIIWMLLTCRPDLLPIDLKRQGRAEVHIPMFYPQDEAEVREMFLAMARKNKVALAADAVPAIRVQRQWSGADIESMVLAAKRRALSRAAAGGGAGRPAQVEAADLEEAVGDFIPSTQGLDKELQELAAALECTQAHFLPPDWRERLAQPQGRTQLQERLMAIRQLLEE